MSQQNNSGFQHAEINAEAAQHRSKDLNFSRWADGQGVIQHTPETQLAVYELATQLLEDGLISHRNQCYAMLEALDCLTNMAMWLVVHMTYSKKVYLDGRPIQAEDFKTDPQGHTGGALNMVPAYSALVALDALTGQHRDWLMGQGHCVAAIDAVQILTGNALPERQKKYPLTDQGLSALASDFYAYRIGADRRPVSTLGSHVNAYTAGAKIEGGYLGFASLQYVHQPLPGERLVAFLSDGAFEEQRGSDWAARWWRANDCGLVAPIMIANGRRIDQRTTVEQQGGVNWLCKHLTHQGFAPFTIDGRDPAAFVCAIYRMEKHLANAGDAVTSGVADYPVPMPYCVAETIKGFGFPGAGTNAAHGLPLGSDVRHDLDAQRFFSDGANALFQEEHAWRHAAEKLRLDTKPEASNVVTLNRHEPDWATKAMSPMAALDNYFINLVEVNPHLRVRVGNPDELSSNRMNQTLDLLKHRVINPEPDIAEAIDGGVITALNEEAVVSACLANQSGLNIVVSYEAFAVKMLGALRQAIIFSRHQTEAGDPANWLGLPVISTSHVWENGKNEQSHQDPILGEALLGEMSDMARVVFPADANTAMACLKYCYGDLGSVWNLIVPKSVMPLQFSPTQAEELMHNGAICVRGNCAAPMQMVACGAYQLEQALKASDRLLTKGIGHSVVYLLEPGRFRQPRDAFESAQMASADVIDCVFPKSVKQRIFLTHIRPEIFLGHVRRIDLGPKATRALGYINQGGTLDSDAMLFANKNTWADALSALAHMSDTPVDRWLSGAELAAINGKGDPYSVIRTPH